MKWIVKCLSVGFLLFMLTGAPVWAHGSTAQISGTVTDQSGAVLPGVEVTVTQTNTGLVRNVITNETGFYVLANLPTGPYRLEVALPGFRTFVQTGIVLEVNSNPTVHVVLQVGQVSERVEVLGNAAMVETRSSGVGQIIENERILELPLNGRNAVDLITLAGAAVTTQTSSTRSMAGQQAISVAGGLDSGVAYQLDGAMYNNPYDNLSLPLPFPDALQEFKVETSALSASQGRHTGAQVNSVTKSGTNDFHGDVFWFHRNDDFSARPFFSLKENTLKRNQFGGTLGGPIVRNKLFFFGGYQGTTLRQDPSNIESFVATPAMLAGDFTAFASPACNGGRQITLRGPFVNNRIDPGLFSPAALNISRRFPAPRDECGRVTTGIRTATDDGQVVSKVDYQLSDRQSLFGRFVATLNETDVPNSFEPNNLLNTAAAGFDNLAQSYAFGDTYLFGPNTVNAFRLTVNRSAIHRIGPEFFEPRDVGINAFSAVPGLTILSVTGGFNIGSGVQSEARFRTTAAWRPLITPGADENPTEIDSSPAPLLEPSTTPNVETEPAPSKPEPARQRNYTWSELMKRLFFLDVLQCERCGGRMKILAAIHPPDTTGKILECLGLPTRAPPIAAPAISDFTAQTDSF